MEFSADSIVEKIRYFINYQGAEWVVDEFFGRNRGTGFSGNRIEIREGVIFEKPAWLGEDVSNDYRYCNSNLSQESVFENWDK